MVVLPKNTNYCSTYQALEPICVINLSTKNAFISCNIKSILISYLTARRATKFRGLSILSFASGLTLGTAFGLNLKENFEIDKVRLLVRARGKLYKSIIQGLIKAHVFPVLLIRVLDIPHNGCRWKKRRR
jgi:hypothetical protein